MVVLYILGTIIFLAGFAVYYGFGLWMAELARGFLKIKLPGPLYYLFALFWPLCIAFGLAILAVMRHRNKS